MKRILEARPSRQLQRALWGGLVLAATVTSPVAAQPEPRPSPTRPAEATGHSAEAPSLWQRGTAAWQARAENHLGGRAAPGPIRRAVVAYREALAIEPDNLGTRTQLLRALFFEGEYVPMDVNARKRIFEEGRTVFEKGVDQFADRHGGRKIWNRLPAEEVIDRLRQEEDAQAVGEFYFFGAIHWGLWARYFGTMAALRRGVAVRIRDNGEIARTLYPTQHDAGPLRLLGRMHVIAPRVPLFTGWINHRHGLELLRAAHSQAPEDPLNRFFLAEAILEVDKKRRSEAFALMCSALSMEVRPGRTVEDIDAIARSRTTLQKWVARERRRGRTLPCNPE